MTMSTKDFFILPLIVFKSKTPLMTFADGFLGHISFKDISSIELTSSLMGVDIPQGNTLLLSTISVLEI